MTPAYTLDLLDELDLLRPEPPEPAAWRNFLDRLEADPSRDAAASSTAEARSRALVREAPVMTFTLSVLDGSITSLNPAFETLTGRRRSDWLNRPMTALAHAEDLPRLVAAIHRVTLGESPPPFELRLQTPSDSVITAEWMLKPLREAGKVTAVLGFAYDVTRRKLDERDLSTAKHAAEAANHAKGEFLASMSHEIRTPMNAIVGMTSLLLDTRLDERQRSFTETLKASCHTLLDLIDGILDFSKIESGKLELEKRPFDLRQTVSDAVAMVEAQASSKGLQLSYAFSDACPNALEGDVVRVRQVLVNLLSNAVKFTDTGSVRIWVGSEPLETDRHRIRFEVWDTGCGIAPEQHDKIFGAFSQAQPSTSRRYGGTGLGLSICRRLTELMGGEIGVQSRLGDGSLFYFTLEAREARLPVRVEISGEFDAKLAVKHPLSILVADDNEVNRQVAQLLLARRGYEPDLAVDGLEVLAALDRKPYDLVLMDVLMPNMDGLQATREIRRRYAAPLRPQVIAMTAGAMEGDREQCLAAGMVDFLTKPIHEDELETVLILCSQRTRESASGELRPLIPRPATASKEEEPVLTSLLQELYEVRPERVPPLVESFLEHTRQALVDLHKEIQAGQIQQVQEISHSLKGSCHMLGARRMGNLCGRLEALARSGGSLDGAREILADLDRELVPVAKRLDRFVDA